MRFGERKLFLGFRPRRGRWVRYAPMAGHRLTRPDGANLRRCVVTDGEHEIQGRDIGFGEFRPTL